MSKTYLGVDIGGTAVKLGLVDENGRVLRRAERSVSFDGYKTPILDTVQAAIHEFLTADAPRLEGIAVSATGQIDSRRGVVAGTCGNFPGWIGVDIKGTLEPLLESGIDTLIMGCTHYPLLRSTLRQIMGEKVNLVNPAYETARELKSLLEREGLNNDGKQNYEGAMHEFYVSDAANKFKNFANSILPYGVDTTQLIHIEDY